MFLLILLIAAHPVTIFLTSMVDWDLQSPGAMLEGARLEGARRLTSGEGMAEAFMVVFIALVIFFIVAVVIPLIIWIVFACTYKSKVTDLRPALPNPVPAEYSLEGGKDFKYTPWQLGAHSPTCLHSFFCLDVRAADTWQTTGVASYWCVVLIFVLEWICSQILGSAINQEMTRTTQEQWNVGSLAWYMVSFFFAFYFANLRQKYRELFGGGPGNFAKDFLMFWCCSCCAINQDALQLDGATGAKAECCCNLIKTQQPGGPVMGVPVMVKGEVVGNSA